MDIFPLVAVDPENRKVMKDVMDGRCPRSAIQQKLDILFFDWEDPVAEPGFYTADSGHDNIVVVTETGPCDEFADAQWFAFGKSFRGVGLICKWRDGAFHPLAGAEAEAVILCVSFAGAAKQQRPRGQGKK
jgi:hypothetical protein